MSFLNRGGEYTMTELLHQSIFVETLVMKDGHSLVDAKYILTLKMLEANQVYAKCKPDFLISVGVSKDIATTQL